MTRRFTTIAIAALLLLSVFAVLGGVAVAQDDNATDYTLTELQKSGEVRNEEIPSLRVLGAGTGIWAVNYEAGPLKSYGSSDAKSFLEAGDKIERNRIRFTASHPWDGKTRNYTFKKIYWHRDSRVIETANGTVSQSYPNVTGVGTQVLTFESGMQKDADLSLRPHYDRAEQVTILMLDDDGDTLARWGPYTHKSVQTTASLPFEPNWSSFFPWFTLRFLTTFTIGGVAAVFFGFKFTQKAVKGPGKGMVWWLFVSGIIIGVALFGWWTNVVALIVAIPALLAFPPILLIFVAAMEYSKPAKTALLEEAEIKTTKDPLGEDAPEIVSEYGSTVSIVDVAKGYGFVSDGSIRASLARYFAGVAIVPDSDIPMEHPYGGPSAIDMKFYVNDFDFTPARWTWQLPTLRRTVETDDGVSKELRLGRIITWIGALVIGAAVSMQVWNTPYLGLVAGAVPIVMSGATALPAEVEIDFAESAKVKAKAARLTQEKALAKWETFDDLAEAVGDSETAGYDLIMDTLDEYRDQVNERLDTLMDPSGNRTSSNGSGNEKEVAADGE